MDLQLMDFQLMDYIVDGLQLLMDFQLTEFILMEFMLMYLTECRHWYQHSAKLFQKCLKCDPWNDEKATAVFRLKIYREARQNMPIQDYMVDENHWHFTNFNLKHLCVWHTIDREKLRKVKLVGFTDDDNRTKVLKKSRRDCSSKANWAMNGMKHQNCFIISVARAALCQVDSPGDWGTRKLGAQMGSGSTWSYTV